MEPFKTDTKVETKSKVHSILKDFLAEEYPEIVPDHPVRDLIEHWDNILVSKKDVIKDVFDYTATDP
jgi:hypothetical protein